MKICFLAHAVSIHTRRWLYYFRDRGHQVSIISFTPAKLEPGIELYYLQPPWSISYEYANWHYLFHLPRVRQIVHHLQPDLLNAHYLSSYGFLGALIKPRGCPLVSSLHGNDILIFPKESFLHRWVISFALKRADMITSVAQHMTQVLGNYMSGDKPVLTLQYGVDTALFCSPATSTPRLPVCLSNRAMVSDSNLETVLQAARILEDTNSPVHLDMAGEGELAALLRQKATELHLESRLSFLGHIEHARMANKLKTAALFVSMSITDGTPLSLLEAMACGAFPVVSDIPANREWVTDGVNGYLVPLYAPEQLAHRLNEAWHQPELREAAAQYNWQLIQEKGDYQKNMAIIETAFTRLLEHEHERASK
jgi:glycosyltransferase involved in cell wall biosynthesis